MCFAAQALWQARSQLPGASYQMMLCEIPCFSFVKRRPAAGRRRTDRTAARIRASYLRQYGVLLPRCQVDSTSCIIQFAGLLLAAGALRSRAHPGIMHLHTPNAHVGAALEDWRRAGSPAAALPRQAQPAGGGGHEQLAGASSFGMSGVNAHMLLGASGTTSTAPQVTF